MRTRREFWLGIYLLAGIAVWCWFVFTNAFSSVEVAMLLFIVAEVSAFSFWCIFAGGKGAGNNVGLVC